MLCLRYHIALRAIHIAGVDNGEPDALSRGKQGQATADYFFSRYEDYNEPPHTFDAATDLDSLNRQPGCTDSCSAGKDSFLTNWPRAAGQRIFCNPPFSMVGEFMIAAESAWALDEQTSVTMVVPAWETSWWWRRALRRRNPVWREVDRIAGTEPLYFRGEAARLRAGLPQPPLDKPPGWDTVILAFP